MPAIQDGQATHLQGTFQGDNTNLFCFFTNGKQRADCTATVTSFQALHKYAENAVTVRTAFNQTRLGRVLSRSLLQG